MFARQKQAIGTQTEILKQLLILQLWSQKFCQKTPPLIEITGHKISKTVDYAK